MRATEFIKESSGIGKIHKDQKSVQQGISKSRDVGGYDRVYHQNRFMMATAMADGKSDTPVDMDEASWIEKFNTHHPYTEAEYNMIKSAVNTIPTEYHEISPWSKSTEPDDTHRVSPTPDRKKLK